MIALCFLLLLFFKPRVALTLFVALCIAMVFKLFYVYCVIYLCVLVIEGVRKL